MKTLWLRIVPALVSLLIVSGCSSAPALSAMLLTIDSARLDSTRTKAELELTYTNENVFGLAISSTSGSLYLNDVYIGKFVQDVAVGVSQLSTAKGKATLMVEKPDELRALIKNTKGSTFTYRLVSKMRLEIAEEKTTIKNESTGQIDRAQMTAEQAQ
jgi:LEA14-like dessication related protein